MGISLENKKNELDKMLISNSLQVLVVEYSRLELLTSTLPVLRSTG